MAITFLHPLFLLLVPAIALVWLVPGRAREKTHLVLRSLVFLVLVLALAQPVLLTSDRDMYQVFVVDESASVSPEARRVEHDAVAALQSRAGIRALTSLVVIGDGTKYEGGNNLDASAFDDALQLDHPHSTSPLGAAMAMAAGRIPVDARGVIHLFTDGRSTDRRWAPAVQDVIEREIVLNTYDVGLDARDVYPAAIEVNGLLRVGQTARVAIEIVGTAPHLRVRLLGDDGEEIAASGPLASDERTRVPLTFEPKAAGFLQLTAEVITGPDDADPRNNRLTHTFAIQEPLRVLYLGDRMAGGSTRVGSLLGPGFDVTDASNRLLDGDADLSAYDLVLLDDRPASKTPPAFQTRVADAVAHRGLGLVFSGGRAAFGTGGYDGTPISKIVPVDFAQRTEKRDPSTALAVIIDTSGSMTGTRIELAKQVTRLAVRRLKPHDRIGIVEFYGNKHWALPMQSAANKVTIDRAIGRMQATGGTVLMPAIEEAYYGLKNVDTRYKHIVIITDAGVESANYEGLIRQIARDGVNVSTVLTGAQAHNQVMIDLASWGKGRFYSVVDRYSLPELILKQPSTMKLPAYKTGAFTVESRGGAGWWSDVDRRALPPLNGYVETTMKSGAEALLEVAGSKDPVLATWRYGLGRVTALMTEPVGEGTRGWNSWRDYGPVLARVATRTADDVRLFNYELSRNDHMLTVTARRDSRDLTLIPHAAVLTPSSASESLSFAQDAPGYFSATLAIDPRAEVRLLATAYSASAPSRRQQPTRLISTPFDDVSPELQVDPERGLDLERLAEATGGIYTDARALVAGTFAQPSPAPPTREGVGLSARRLWPLLLAVALILYLVEIAYRRWPGAS